MKVNAADKDEPPLHITEPVLSSKAYRKRWAALIKNLGYGSSRMHELLRCLEDCWIYDDEPNHQFRFS